MNRENIRDPARQLAGKNVGVSHKPVAVAAGLGRIGVDRNVIHSKFGNFILRGTVAIDLDFAHSSAPLDLIPAANANFASPPARPAPSRPTATSTSRPAIRIRRSQPQRTRAVIAQKTWVRFLRKEAGLPWALLSRRIKLRGDLLAFGKRFPS